MDDGFRCSGVSSPFCAGMCPRCETLLSGEGLEILSGRRAASRCDSRAQMQHGSANGADGARSGPLRAAFGDVMQMGAARAAAAASEDDRRQRAAQLLGRMKSIAIPIGLRVSLHRLRGYKGSICIYCVASTIKTLRKNPENALKM